MNLKYYNKVYIFIIKKIKSILIRIIPQNIRQKISSIIAILRGKRIFIVDKNSYSGDGLATNHITDFLKDDQFIQNYDEAAKGTNHKIIYRAYILNYFAEYSLRLFNDKKGCFIELGTHKGLMAKIILLNSKFENSKINFYLFDTFAGIPLDNILENEIKHVTSMNQKNYKEDVFEFVEKKFLEYPFVKLVKGKLPITLNQNNLNLDNIQFLHIDLNNAYSEIESIKILYDKLLPGAPVILDDYCYSEDYRSQKDAWDSFIRTKQMKILSLPTGQGIFFKV